MTTMAMRIHDVERIEILPARVLTNSQVHIRDLHIHCKDGTTFKMDLFGLTFDQAPIVVDVVGEPTTAEFQEACDELATLRAELSEKQALVLAQYEHIDQKCAEITALKEQLHEAEAQIKRLRATLDCDVQRGVSA